jgi:hypothetical protein
MGRSIVIPEEHLPTLTYLPGSTIPRLPALPTRGIGGCDGAASKAEFYYMEALQKLALAKYWAEKKEY